MWRDSALRASTDILGNTRFMWEETRQVATDNPGGSIFYRMRVL